MRHEHLSFLLSSITPSRINTAFYTICSYLLFGSSDVSGLYLTF